MPKNLIEFLSMMDERLWFRMVVCFLPGLVLLKLFGYSADGSVLSMLAAAVLILGVAIYLLWGRLRGLPPAIEEDVEGEDQLAVASGAAALEPVREVSGLDQLAVLTELRRLCGEGERESDRLIATEIQVNPHMSFAEAARTALARRRIIG